MTPSDPSSAAPAVPCSDLFSRALRGGLVFWSINVALGAFMACLDWPVRMIESVYAAAVWMAVIPFVALLSGVPGFAWENWAWMVGTVAWLPLVIAFRFVHLFSVQDGRRG